MTLRSMVIAVIVLACYSTAVLAQRRPVKLIEAAEQAVRTLGSECRPEGVGLDVVRTSNEEYYCDDITDPDNPVWALRPGGTALAAGDTGEVQFNVSDVLAASPNMAWDNTLKTLTLKSDAATAFDPTSIASYEFWFDADDEASIAGLSCPGDHGAYLTTWTDESAVYTATADGTLDPTLQCATGPNGTNWVWSKRTDGAHFDMSPTKVYGNGDSFTICGMMQSYDANTAGPVLVGEVASATASKDYIDTWGNYQNGDEPQYQSAGSGADAYGQSLCGDDQGAGCSGVNCPSGCFQGTDDFFVTCVVVAWNGVASDWEVTYASLNGIDQLQSNGVSDADDDITISVIMGQNGGFTDLMLFSDALTAAQLDNVENYLAAKGDIDKGDLDTMDPDLTGSPGALIVKDDGGTSNFTVTGAGEIAAGLTMPERQLHVLNANPQLRLSYDATTYNDIWTDSAGVLNISGVVDLGGSSCTSVISLIDDPSVSATSYWSLTGLGSSATEADAQQFMVPAVSVDFHSLNAKVDTAPGAGKSWLVTLRDDGADTSLTCTISDTDTDCNPGDTTNVVDAAALSLMSISVVPSGTPTAADDMRISLCTSPN